MKRLSATLVLLALIVSPTLLPGCNGKSVYESMSGEDIYRRLCETCHGPEGRAMTGVANSYAGKRKLWTEEKLLAFVDNPQGYRSKMPHLVTSSKLVMPPLSRSVPPEARKRLVEHVLQMMEALEPD